MALLEYENLAAVYVARFLQHLAHLPRPSNQT